MSAALVLLPVLPFTMPSQISSTQIIIAVLVLAVLSTAVAYILYFHLIQTIDSTKALTVTYLIPFFAMLWGAIVLDEPMTSSMILGCSLILLGTAIANNLFTTIFTGLRRFLEKNFPIFGKSARLSRALFPKNGDIVSQKSP